MHYLKWKMCTDIYCQICLVLKHSQINEEWKHLIRCYPFTNKFIQFNNQKFTIKCSSNSKMCFIITWLPHYKISINATPVYIRNEKWNTYTSINDGLIDHIWLIRLNWMIKLIENWSQRSPLPRVRKLLYPQGSNCKTNF